MKKIVYLLPLFVFIMLIGFFIIGLDRDPHLIPSPLIGKSSPVFSLPGLIEEKQLLTQEDLLGEVVLLNVWATWCSVCRREHSLLMEIAKNNEVAIYGIDYKDNRTDAIRWLEQLGNPYKAVIYDHDGNLGIDWGVYGTPETFILDKTGVVRYKHIGEITMQDWIKTIQPLIKVLKQS